MSMFLSKFSHSLRIAKNQYVVFNSIVFSPVVLTKNEKDNIMGGNLYAFSSKELDLLANKGILIENNKQDDDAEDFLRNCIRKTVKNKIPLLYIIPYGGCNLACKYCFLGKINNSSAQTMSRETIDNIVIKFVDHLRKTNQKEGTVIFYGGEPTFNFPVLKYAVEKIREHSEVNIGISIVTNATLITDEMITFFAKKEINVGISIDGPKKTNDTNRIFKGSTKSVYDVVLYNITRIKSKNIPVGLSVTLTDAVLDDKKFLNWLKKLGISDINFNLLHFTSFTDDWKTYYKKASHFLFKAYDELSPLGIKDDRILRKIRAFHGKDFQYNDCGAVGAQQLTIKPNGDMTICHGFWNSQKEYCGNININSFKDVFSSEIYKKWNVNLVINKKKCLKCPAIYICGGGCPAQAENLFGSQQSIDKAFCIHTKYSLRELFKRQLKK